MPAWRAPASSRRRVQVGWYSPLLDLPCSLFVSFFVFLSRFPSFLVCAVHS